jgi:hypothetical protein
MASNYTNIFISNWDFWFESIPSGNLPGQNPRGHTFNLQQTVIAKCQHSFAGSPVLTHPMISREHFLGGVTCSSAAGTIDI